MKKIICLVSVLLAIAIATPATAADKKVPMTTVKIKGPGEIVYVDYQEGGVHVNYVYVQGATEKTTLTINNKAGINFIIRDLYIEGELGTLNAKNAMLSGNLDVYGGINTVKLALVGKDARIWAPWIGKFSVVGFYGEMYLHGGILSPNGQVLDKFSAIEVGDCFIEANGDVGTFAVGYWDRDAILAVGVYAGWDGIFFTNDDKKSYRGGSIEVLKYKGYNVNEGDREFGVILGGNIKKIKAKVLPLEYYDFNIKMVMN